MQIAITTYNKKLEFPNFTNYNSNASLICYYANFIVSMNFSILTVIHSTSRFDSLVPSLAEAAGSITARTNELAINESTTGRAFLVEQ